MRAHRRPRPAVRLTPALVVLAAAALPAAPAAAAPGDVYAVHNTIGSADVAAAPQRVVEIDPQTGEERLVGSLRPGDIAGTIAVTRNGRIFIGLLRDGNFPEVHEMSPSTGQLRRVRLRPRSLEQGHLAAGPRNTLYTMGTGRGARRALGLWRVPVSTGRGRLVVPRMPGRLQAGEVLVDQLSGRLYVAQGCCGDEIHPGVAWLLRLSRGRLRVVPGTRMSRAGIEAVRGRTWYAINAGPGEGGRGGAASGYGLAAGSVTGGGPRQVVPIAEAPTIDALAAGRGGVFAALLHAEATPTEDGWGGPAIARLSGGQLVDIRRYPDNPGFVVTEIAVQPHR